MQYIFCKRDDLKTQVKITDLYGLQIPNTSAFAFKGLEKFLILQNKSHNKIHYDWGADSKK